MAEQKPTSKQTMSRDLLAELLNEDLLARIPGHHLVRGVFPGVEGAEYMSIAEQLMHAQQELKHALIISRQIDYLGKMPSVDSQARPDFRKGKGNAPL